MKHRHSRRGGSRGMSGFLAHGIAPKIGGGVMAIGAAGVLGYIAATLNNSLPQVIPYQKQAAGTLGGGVPGLIASFFAGGSSGNYSGGY